MNKYPIKITYDFEEQLYTVFADGINELCGSGKTESSALLDFLIKYENDYSGYKCFNQNWVRNQISKLTILGAYE